MMRSMMAVSLKFGEEKTFSLIPIDIHCPYNEAIYDHRIKTLVIFSKESRDIPQMIEKLDDSGAPMIRKAVKDPNENPYKLERRMLSSYYEYRLTETEDIIDFIKMFAVNSEHPAITAMFV